MAEETVTDDPEIVTASKEEQLAVPVKDAPSIEQQLNTLVGTELQLLAKKAQLLEQLESIDSDLLKVRNQQYGFKIAQQTIAAQERAVRSSGKVTRFKSRKDT